ncbi:MAG: preprotein translocase subunit SecG [Oligoflexia bacterium]|nr:preprotein translocase subunit SecG [Oligoflexia bacterium]
MEQSITLISIIHVFAALFLIVVVLLQDSKGGGIGGAFGAGGASQSLFGASGGANFLVKVTRVVAVVFMLTCIGLTYILSRTHSRSVIDQLPTAPATTNNAVAPSGSAAPAQAAPNQPAPSP